MFVVAILICWLPIQSPDDILPTLVKDYVALGLPVPTSDSKLVEVYHPQQIGFLEKSGEVLIDWDLRTVESKHLKEIDPETWDPSPVCTPTPGVYSGCLVLAIRCYAHGDRRLAGQLLEYEQSHYSADRRAVGHMAFKYVEHAVGQPGVDRLAYDKTLATILETGDVDPQLAGSIAEFRRAIRATVAPNPVRTDYRDGYVDGLVECTRHAKRPYDGSLPVYDNNFYALLCGGIDSVDTLVRHRNDVRLTRETYAGTMPHVQTTLTIGDITEQLLTSIIGDSVIAQWNDEHPDVPSDSQFIEWAERIRASGEAEYMADRVSTGVIAGEGIDVDVDVLHILAIKYPKTLMELLDRLCRSDIDWDPRQMIAVISQRCVPADLGIRTVLLLANSRDVLMQHRVHAARQLFALRNPNAETAIRALLNDAAREQKENIFGMYQLLLYVPHNTDLQKLAVEILPRLCEQERLDVCLDVAAALERKLDDMHGRQFLLQIADALISDGTGVGVNDRSSDGYRGAVNPKEFSVPITVGDILAISLSDNIGLKASNTEFSQWTSSEIGRCREDVATWLRQSITK